MKNNNNNYNNKPLLPQTYLLPASDTSTSSHGITPECLGCYRPVSYRMSLENPQKTNGDQDERLTSLTNKTNQRLAKKIFGHVIKLWSNFFFLLIESKKKFFTVF